MLPLLNNSSLSDSGATYVFTRNQGGANQWGQVKKLAPSDLASGDHFGSSLAINADALVVGAQLADGNGLDSGAAYLFTQNQGGSNVWGQVDKFLPAAVGASDNFGSAVAISSGTIVAGAYNGLDSGIRSGTAFMFRIKYNNGPRVLSPLADQTVTVNLPFTFTMPAGTFSDPDVNETLLLTLGSSPAAPVWLVFDPPRRDVQRHAYSRQCLSHRRHRDRFRRSERHKSVCHERGAGSKHLFRTVLGLPDFWHKPGHRGFSERRERRGLPVAAHPVIVRKRDLDGCGDRHGRRDRHD